MTVAYEERSQEDEHSCFSDNTIADIVANAAGIQRVYMGQYGAVSGPGIKDLIAAEDPELANPWRMKSTARLPWRGQYRLPSTTSWYRDWPIPNQAAKQSWTR